MDLLRRKKSCLIAFVVVCVVNIQMIVAPPDSFVDCSDLTNDHLQPCAEGKVCVWNHCRCPGKGWCRLVCSNDPRKRCTGLDKGDSCDLEVPGSTCRKSRRLICIPPTTVDEGPTNEWQ